MLSIFQDWLQNKLQTPQTSETSHDVATAVLLYEVMRADRDFNEQEQVVYRQQLQQHFSLTPDELDTLCDMSKSQAEGAVDYQQFTRVVNDYCGPEQKRKILDSLWAVAFSDHQLSPDEEYTIRKIADLLYIPHSQFIQSKLANQPGQ